jgi:hypothetical protein
MVDECTHSDCRAFGYYVAEPTIFVDKVLISRDTRQSTGDAQCDAEALEYYAVKVRVFFQLDPAQSRRILVLELLSEALKLFGLRQ